EVTRFLLGRGAVPDIFMAAGLGDLELAQKLVGDNPECTAYRIGNNSGPFPGMGHRVPGGTIYQWTLGFNQSPQEIAFHRGHSELYDFLMKHTPARQRLLVACILANRPLAEEIVLRNPTLVSELDQEDKALLAKSCWETNLNREVVRLMLDLGFPVDVPEFNHGYLPLHNAAWCGDAELVELLLQRSHPVDRRDPNHQATALGFAIHSCVVAKRHPEGNFPRVVRLLLEAGTPLSKEQYPTGVPEIDAVIESQPKL
ncbi:MAG: ankyrin repeat protein, partial [Verrucomicrobiales bacterium]|nr:ankyrin repeat protein [Verrucomicrobiales bacterium]